MGLLVLCSALAGLVYGLLSPEPWPALSTLPRRYPPRITWQASWPDPALARSWVEALAASEGMEEAWVGRAPPEIAPLLPEGAQGLGGWRSPGTGRAVAWFTLAPDEGTWQELERTLRRAGWREASTWLPQSRLGRLLPDLFGQPLEPWSRVFCREGRRLDLRAWWEDDRLQVTLERFPDRDAWPCRQKVLETWMGELARILMAGPSRGTLPLLQHPPGNQARPLTLVPNRDLVLVWVTVDNLDTELVDGYTKQLQRQGWQPLDQVRRPPAYFGRWKRARGQPIQVVLLPLSSRDFLLGLAREPLEPPPWEALTAPQPPRARGDITPETARRWVERFLIHYLLPDDALILAPGQQPPMPLPPAWQALGMWEVRRALEHGGGGHRTWLLHASEAVPPERWLEGLRGRGWRVTFPPGPPGLQVERKEEPVAFLCGPQGETFTVQQWPAREGYWLHAAQGLMAPPIAPCPEPPSMLSPREGLPRLTLPDRTPAYPGPPLEGPLFQSTAWVPRERLPQVARALEAQLRDQGWRPVARDTLRAVTWSVWKSTLPQARPVVLVLWPLDQHTALVLLVPWPGP